jgi:cell division protein FtsB
MSNSLHHTIDLQNLKKEVDTDRLQKELDSEKQRNEKLDTQLSNLIKNIQTQKDLVKKLSLRLEFHESRWKSDVEIHLKLVEEHEILVEENEFYLDENQEFSDENDKLEKQIDLLKKKLATQESEESAFDGQCAEIKMHLQLSIEDNESRVNNIMKMIRKLKR